MKINLIFYFFDFILKQSLVYWSRKNQFQNISTYFFPEIKITSFYFLKQSVNN